MSQPPERTLGPRNPSPARSRQGTGNNRLHALPPRSSAVAARRRRRRARFGARIDAHLGLSGRYGTRLVRARSRDEVLAGVNATPGGRRTGPCISSNGRSASSGRDRFCIPARRRRLLTRSMVEKRRPLHDTVNVFSAPVIAIKRQVTHARPSLSRHRVRGHVRVRDDRLLRPSRLSETIGRRRPSRSCRLRSRCWSRSRHRARSSHRLGQGRV